MKISIITPCLNRAKFLPSALQCVLDQEYPEFEHIIVDGGSTDGTLEILAQYPHLRVISEPDNGMYSAINKGIGLARGDIVGFLNSDDIYPPGVFKSVEKSFSGLPVQAAAGRAELFRTNSDGLKEILLNFPPPKPDQILHQMILGVPAFNAWFFHIQVVHQLKSFVDSYRIISDREFMIRFALAKIPYVLLDKVTYAYRQHSESMTISEGDANESRVVPEHLRMTESFLASSEITEEARRLLIQMRTRDTSNLAVYNLRHRKYSELAGNLRKGMKYDKAWLAKFVLRIMQSPFRRRGETNANR